MAQSLNEVSALMSFFQLDSLDEEGGQDRGYSDRQKYVPSSPKG
jgi:hypothetical protein